MTMYHAIAHLKNGDITPIASMKTQKSLDAAIDNWLTDCASLVRWISIEQSKTQLKPVFVQHTKIIARRQIAWNS